MEKQRPEIGKSGQQTLIIKHPRQQIGPKCHLRNTVTNFFFFFFRQGYREPELTNPVLPIFQVGEVKDDDAVTPNLRAPGPETF